ncbi:37S ribosomal protein S24, mitochondrial [Xylographa opegraphella]|nr:37S ribosomal protein S24, mitochondrial [Xylographa opegraphella]
MASTMHTLRLTAQRSTCRITPRSRNRLFQPALTCPFSTTTRRNAPDSPAPYSFRDSLDSSNRAFYDSLSPEDRIQYEQDAIKLDEYMTSPAVEARLNAEVSEAAYEVLSRTPRERPFPGSNERFKSGLMAMGEINEMDSGEDEVFEGDDMSSIAHGELEQHRELRAYARIAAWEMPLLSKLAKPFEPPTTTPLRFRYTDYFGETHPARFKIVCEFSPMDLPLTPAQRLTLIKLVGVRYDPQRDLVRMSCEMFETQAQNKRYLGDLVDTLIKEAKEGEAFEDVPVDFRHVKWQDRKEFPEGWKLSGGKREALEERRRERERKEQERVARGQIVDGVRVIEAAMKAARAEERVEIPIGKRLLGGKEKGPMAKGRQRLVR